MTAMAQRQVQLLNASFEELQWVSLQKAARLLSRDKVVIQESVPGEFLGPWARPLVLRLKEFVKVAYEKLHGPPRVSRRGILGRDNHECGYCGAYASTIDHVKPKSKGGPQTWTNLVAACGKCNRRKGNKPLGDPRIPDMKLRIKPRQPTKAEVKRY